MTSRIFWALLVPLLAQTEVLTLGPSQPLAGKRGEPLQVRTNLQLADGYHLNSNKPDDPYLIPLRITWDPKTVETIAVDFPAAKKEKYEFSDKPLSVFTGDFVIASTVKPKIAGFTVLTGKLRYQACSRTVCLPPKTIEVKIPADFR